MVSKPMRFLSILLLVISWTGAGLCKSKGDVIFTDDFEKGTAKWDLVNPARIEIVETGDPAHGKVLSLQPGGPGVYALIKDSEKWNGVRLEWEVYFPYDFAHYLGFIYNYRESPGRADFGCIFMVAHHPPMDKIKDTEYGQDPLDYFLDGGYNFALVNPHRDSNANRSLSPEYRVDMEEGKQFMPRKWHKFKAEVIGPICHLYIGDMETPTITYNFFEFSSGRFGFKPRFSGSLVWLDNIKAARIKEFGYKGPILPAGIIHKPEKLITQWDFIGPFGRRIPGIEKDGFLPGKTYADDNKEFKWEPFQTDGRGCVVSGRICEKFSSKIYVYFHTEIVSENQKEVALEFSSTDRLMVWLNGSSLGLIMPQGVAWYDFRENPEHAGKKVKAVLKPGKNHLLVLCGGGVYGGDGFYAFCRDKSQDKESGQKEKTSE
jgi:hypothetical protein